MDQGKVLVTGGAGFIGSHLTDRLLDEGYDVLVLDDLSSGKIDNISGTGYEFIEGDIRDDVLLEKILDDPDKNISTIFHLAAQISVGKSMESPVQDAEINYLGTLNLINAAKKAGISRIIYSSSYCIYGTPEKLPVLETDDIRPVSYYGLSKYSGEIALNLAKGIDVFIFRGGNIYGPRQSNSNNGQAGIIPTFYNKIVMNERPELRGYGRTIRDYTYIDDAIDFIMNGIYAEPGTYNIGWGRGISVLDVWETLAESCKRRGMKIPEPIYTELKTGEIERMVVSADKAYDMFGWKPHIQFADGIEKTIDYMEQYNMKTVLIGEKNG